MHGLQISTFRGGVPELAHIGDGATTAKMLRTEPLAETSVCNTPVLALSPLITAFVGAHERHYRGRFGRFAIRLGFRFFKFLGRTIGEGRM